MNVDSFAAKKLLLVFVLFILACGVAPGVTHFTPEMSVDVKGSINGVNRHRQDVRIVTADVLTVRVCASESCPAIESEYLYKGDVVVVERQGFYNWCRIKLSGGSQFGYVACWYLEENE